MCDPIIDDSIRIDKEPFTQEVVREYLRTKDHFNRHPLRHYSQVNVVFDDAHVVEMLGKLGIPVMGTFVTVFGGYTGQFASCLRRIGMQVIFTDPLEEWVQNASNSGFESYKYAAEEIPKELSKRSELFSTFECYPVFLEGSTADYTTLRFLSSKHGILFAESKYTRDELIKEGGRLQMKYSFLPFSKLYLIKRSFTSKGDLRLYHFSASDTEEEKIKLDCRVMKNLYDLMSRRENPIQLGNIEIATLANNLKLPEEMCLASLERIMNLYQLGVPRTLQAYFPDNLFGIFSKRFEVDLKVFQGL